MRSREMENKPWFIYIAMTRTGRFYTGMSTNPQARIKTHNKGNGAKFAVNQGPFVLVYVSDPVVDRSRARKLEIKVKDWSQAKKNKLISGKWRLDEENN